jgi:hypothetical protein
MRDQFFLSIRPFVLQNGDLMKKNQVLILGVLAASTLGAPGALVWTVGLDDNGWPLGNGGGPNASFMQEQGVINALPGNPNNAEVDQQSDNDYYFAGDYTSPAPNYPAYSPVGNVTANEESAERAFAGADNDLRYHFNLPASFNPLDTLTVTYDILNLHEGNPDTRYGIEVYFNNILVQPEIVMRPADYNVEFTTAAFSLASVNAVTGPGTDNIVSLRGINYNAAGGGNWMGIDYVQLDVQPIPEPGSAAMVLLGAIGCSAFFGRRRARR